ncbi:MAG: TerC family protein [Deltaproteobacteria bacterium]|nr:TerC family protein [Deltaproteobacteria bacterium]
MTGGLLWGVFGVVVVVMLALDLGVFHRKAHDVSVKEALGWTVAWIALALGFNLAIRIWIDPSTPPDMQRPSVEFLTCYLTEYALSVDNIFVFLVIFRYFGIPSESQHRVLFWGILGAALMRALFLVVGIEAIERWHWTIYVLGGLLIVTGIKLLFQKEEDLDPEKNFVLRLARRYMSVTDRYEGSKFFIRHQGKRYATPLFLALLVVETTDVLFAVDSVPAALGISKNLFVVYTSNIFAILGLRSLFFAVGGLLKYLHYLKYGLSLILVFVGIKMLVSSWSPIPVEASLGVVGGILLLAIVASMIRSWIVGKEADAEAEELVRGVHERRHE